MLRRVLVSVVLLILVALLPAAGLAGVTGQEAAPEKLPDGPFVARIYYEQLEDYRGLAGFDVFEYNNVQEKYWLAAVDAEQYDRLQALGFRVQVDEVETASFAQLAVPLTEQVGVDAIPGYSCYRTVEETFATAQAIVANHPTLATWSDVGNSWEKSVGQPDGYDLMVLVLTNSAVAGPKPKLFITASIHAREYTPAELATRFAEHLVDNYGTDADATWLLDHHEIHLMLQANPDGRKEAEAGYSWRKNTNENYCGVTSSNRGADLNRNFTFKWGCCGGSSGYPCDATYRGPAANSEPETQAIQAYMAAIFPDQRGPNDTDAAPADATGIYIDLHSYSELVLWPWGWTSTNAPNATQLQTLGRKFAYFNSYTPQKAYSLYPTDGTTNDHAYGVYGVAGYCFELGTAFFQACTTFESTIYPNNLQALIYAAKVVRTPYMTPLGPDALSLAVAPDAVTIGEPAVLTATINDTRYRSGAGEPTQAIAAAEYYVDTPPWQGGAAIAMAASDGSFNSTVENVTATVGTAGLAPGRHIVFVRGRDANGNWGAFSAVFLETRMFTVTPASLAICAPADAAYTVNVGYAASVALSAGGAPAGTTVTFAPNPVTGPAGSTLTIGSTGAAAAGSYTVAVTGIGGPFSQTTPVQLDIATPLAAGPALAAPADGSTDIATTTGFTWNAVAGATGYDIEVATDPAFTNIVASAYDLAGTSFTPGSALAADTVHYWRVYAENGCGSRASSIRAFRTAAAGCVTYASSDVPKTISDLTTIYSNITVPDVFSVTDVNVTIGSIVHTYDADLDIYLEHPDNTAVELSTDNGGSGDHYTNTVFDDEVSNVIGTTGNNTAPFTGTYNPEGTLATLDGKTSFGTWQLRIYDDASLDTGTLNSWSLTLCGAPTTPAADYSDLASAYGVAWHTGTGAWRLGSGWTADSSFAAGHDDINYGDASDDGVARDANASWNDGRGEVDVTVTGTAGQYACLNAWLDYSDGTVVAGTPDAPNGAFDANEHVVVNQALGPGTTQVTWPLASGVIDANALYNMRFRLVPAPTPTDPGSCSGVILAAAAPAGGADLTDAAAGGEVEDYTFSAGPTAILLASMTATGQADAVEVTWDTVSEVANAGFNLYRDISDAGPGVKLNEDLIPSQGSGSPEGYHYVYLDSADLAPNTTYWYWLEDVSTSGVATRHEPISVLYEGEPTAVTLAAFGGARAAGPALIGLAALAALAVAGVARRKR